MGDMLRANYHGRVERSGTVAPPFFTITPTSECIDVLMGISRGKPQSPGGLSASGELDCNAISNPSPVRATEFRSCRLNHECARVCA